MAFHKHAINVSVILPIYNAGQWLNECLSSILHQECKNLKLELSVFLDSCTDDSALILQKWDAAFQRASFQIKISKENNEKPKGVGYAKNKCVVQSTGEYLCFMDADDIMLPNRVEKQYFLTSDNKNDLIGCRFQRIPEGSTNRFTKWANSLTNEQLNTQIFTSNGPTIIMPTWFCHRSVYDKVGGFQEGRGIPEDLIFFYKHLRLGGRISRCDEELLIYRYHEDATTFSVHEKTIWDLRVKELEDLVLNQWQYFTIWNAGKQGRKFYRSLQNENRKKVTCFCDVDENKIGSFYTFELSEQEPKPKTPIVHFREAKPPFILCMKLDLTSGAFEENLASLNLTEGKHFHHFN